MLELCFVLLGFRAFSIMNVLCFNPETFLSFTPFFFRYGFGGLHVHGTL